MLTGEAGRVGSRLVGGVRGDAGRHASFGEGIAALGKLRVRGREIGAVSQKTDEDELTHRAPGERLGDREQVAEAAGVSGNHHDRALPRCGTESRNQCGLLPQDRLFEFLERRARLDAELVDEQAPRLAVDSQRLHLAPASGRGRA